MEQTLEIAMLKTRMSKLSLKDLCLKTNLVYIAGSSCLLSESPNDYDLFPVKGFFCIPTESDSYKIINVTSNATTLELSGKIVQLCNYKHPSLTSLAESFDFSHIQMGITWDIDKSEIVDLYRSEKQLESIVTKTSMYTGSDFPLSSLLRVRKYLDKGYKIKVTETLKILMDIKRRGYKNYIDFKQQMDAVDLALLSNEDFDIPEVLGYYKEFTN